MGGENAGEIVKKMENAGDVADLSGAAVRAIARGAAGGRIGVLKAEKTKR